MTIYYLGAEVANVALSDSFNTWRITTNKILADAASLSGNNTFSGEITFSGGVTFGGGTSVGQDITANNITASSQVTANLVVSSYYQDSSGRTLTIRDEANTIVWGG
jgi:hypothetical protein